MSELSAIVFLVLLVAIAWRQNKVTTDRFWEKVKALTDVLDTGQPLIMMEKTPDPFFKTKIMVHTYKENYVLYSFLEIEGREVVSGDKRSMPFDYLIKNYERAV